MFPHIPQCNPHGSFIWVLVPHKFDGITRCNVISLCSSQKPQLLHMKLEISIYELEDCVIEDNTNDTQ